MKRKAKSARRKAEHEIDRERFPREIMVARALLGGRPAKYDPARMLPVAQKLCRLGATDADVADALEVSIASVRLWRVQHEEFAQACEVGKDEANTSVVRSLFERARGYTYEGEKIYVIDGNVVRVPTREHVPPDPTAQKFFLTNRDPENWRDRQEHTGNAGAPVQVEVLGGLPGVKDK